MDSENEKFQQSTQRQALYLWSGLLLSMTLFFAGTQVAFIRGEPLPSSQLEWILATLGGVTFVMGLVFYKNYLALRKNRILTMALNDRKQSLLIVFVLQFILFESLGMLGILVAGLTQSTLKGVPYLLFAYVGFYFAFPKKDKITPYFK